MSENNSITNPIDAIVAIDLGVAKGLVDTHDTLLALYTGAIATGDEDTLERVVGALQTVAANIQVVQDNLLGLHLHENGDDDEFFAGLTVDFEPIQQDAEPVTDILGYTITVQAEGDPLVSHAGALLDPALIPTLLFRTVEEAEEYIEDALFEPGSTVHVAQVFGVKQIQTVLPNTK